MKKKTGQARAQLTLRFATMRLRHGLRGPRRARCSQVKIMCAYKKCRSCKDVKNIGKTGRAARVDVNEVLCRPLSPVAQVVRFCSAMGDHHAVVGDCYGPLKPLFLRVHKLTRSLVRLE